MGYSAHLRDSSFHIDADRKRAALSAVRALFDQRDRYAWVNSGDALAARSLMEMLAEWGWPIHLDEDDNVIGIGFDAGDNKLGDEDALFAALAPFVRAGSYLAMVGEGGDHWRWYFDGATCARQEARVRYDD